MPVWLWAGLGLVAIVTVYLVFARGGSSGDDVPLPPAPIASAAIAPSVAEAPSIADPRPVADPPPTASAPVVAPSVVPQPAQSLPNSSKPVKNELAVPLPKKTPDREAKAPVASVPAPKPPAGPPVAVETAKPSPPKIESATESPVEAAPPPGLEDSVAGVETVPEIATTAPATTIAPGTLIPIDEADKTPVALTHRPPAYPLQARQLRLSGTVVMNVLVNERGTVDQVVLVNGVAGAGMNDAAMRAAQSWTYRPATKNGVPVKVWKSEQVVFKL